MKQHEDAQALPCAMQAILAYASVALVFTVFAAVGLAFLWFANLLVWAAIG